MRRFQEVFQDGWPDGPVKVLPATKANNAMPRPAAILVTGDQAAVFRRRETQEGVFRCDVIPEHLTK